MPLLEARYQLTSRLHTEQMALEAPLRRRHFHVRPQEPSQLLQWQRYLTWAERQADKTGDPKLAVAIFERCLVPCSLYIEVWLRYASFLESRQLLGEARAALRRASGVFLKRRVEMLLAHAAFEEQHAELPAARKLLEAAVALRPPSLEALLALANLERRCGRTSAMRLAFERGIEVHNFATSGSQSLSHPKNNLHNDNPSQTNQNWYRKLNTKCPNI